MKKILAILFAASLAVSMVACGGEKEVSKAITDTESKVESVVESVQEEVPSSEEEVEEPSEEEIVEPSEDAELAADTDEIAKDTSDAK